MQITVAEETRIVTLDPHTPIDLSLPSQGSHENSVKALRPEDDTPRGTVPYLETLSTIHRVLDPRTYLEIGVWLGNSLSLARCPSIGIDPAPDIKTIIHPATRIFTMTSDQFFTEQAATAISTPIDLAFIDGMHLLEFVLRDFMYVERHATPQSLIVIDDIFPSHPAQADRSRRTGTWMGDVWKLLPILSQLRPDLVLIPIDTWPSGLLLVTALDPSNRTLWYTYNQIVTHFSHDIAPPLSILGREGVYPPAIVDPFLRTLKSLRPLTTHRRLKTSP